MHYSNDRILVTHAGSLPRIGFSFYAKDRMTGFGGEAKRGTVTDFAKFPGYAELVVSRSTGQSNAGSGIVNRPWHRDAVLASIGFHSACTRRRP